MTIRNRINREAKGLLGFFRAKVNGQGPLDFKPEIIPVIDTMPFYSVDQMRAVYTTNGANPPTNQNVQVPRGQIWLIHSINLKLWTSAVVAANEGAHFEMQIQGLPDSDGVVQDLTIASVQLDTGGTANVPRSASYTYVPGFPLMLPSGTNIQGQYRLDNTTNAYNVSLGILYTQIET